MTQFKTGEGSIKKVRKDILLNLVEIRGFFSSFSLQLYFWAASLLCITYNSLYVF